MTDSIEQLNAALILDALFAADLRERELRAAHLILRFSLRIGRTTTPPLKNRDFNVFAGLRETHIEGVLSALADAKIIQRERGDTYRIVQDPRKWLRPGSRQTAGARAREAELLYDPQQPEMFAQRELEDADPAREFENALGEVEGDVLTNLVSTGAGDLTDLVSTGEKLTKSGSRELTELGSTSQIGNLPNREVFPGELTNLVSPPFKALKAIELKGFKAPKALGAKGAELSAREEKPGPAGRDPDRDLLLERMWRVIPDQREKFAGAWINRADFCPRAMRQAVDKWLESPPRHVRTTAWQWLRAEYIGNAHRLGLSERLSPQDQDRRGWWKRLSDAARHSIWGLA